VASLFLRSTARWSSVRVCLAEHLGERTSWLAQGVWRAMYEPYLAVKRVVTEIDRSYARRPPHVIYGLWDQRDAHAASD
jgi:hypothetical protein